MAAKGGSVALTRWKAVAERAREGARRARGRVTAVRSQLERSIIINAAAAAVSAHAAKADKAFTVWGLSGYRVIALGAYALGFGSRVAEGTRERLIAFADGISAATTSAAVIQFLSKPADHGKVVAKLSGTGGGAIGALGWDGGGNRLDQAAAEIGDAIDEAEASLPD